MKSKIVLLLFLCATLLIAQGSELAYQLAVIDNGDIPRNDSSVIEFERLLTKLDSYFTENKQEIFDETIKAQETLKEEGIKIKLKDLMTGLQDVFPYKVENWQYHLIIIYYISFRVINLNSHSKAISQVKAMIRMIIR